MIYRKKIPPIDSSLSEALINDGWVKIKEPRNLSAAVAASIPFMVMNTVIVISFVPSVRVSLGSALGMLDNGGITLNINFRLLLYAFAFFVFLLVHELLHAVFVPDFISSKKTFWGVAPYGGFVSTTEEMSKLRFVLASAFPFIVLSIAMPGIFGFFGMAGGFVTFLAIVNAMASSVDILNLALIAVQVPRGNRIVNNGFETYHRRPRNEGDYGEYN